MDLELSDYQRALREVAHELLDARAPLTLAHAYVGGAGDPTPLWRAIADVGWAAVGLEDDDPFGVVGLCLIAEACGAHAAPTLVVDTAVAARAVRSLDATGGLAADVATAGAVTALAVLQAHPDAVHGRRRRDGSLELSGAKLGVHHGVRAEVIAVAFELDGEPALALVRPRADGVEVLPRPGLDPASGHAEVRFDGASAAPHDWWAGDAVAPALRTGFEVGAVAVAAEAVGAASAAVDMAVEYALERRQFGRPIGAFQAVQHILAEAHVLRESARATVLHAAGSIDEGLPSASEGVSIAKAHASRATRAAVEHALQVFGGIGFTMEHDAHLLQRRVLECERRFGDSIHHETRLGEMLSERAWQAA